MLRYTTDRARPGLVALYDIRPGNGAGQFLQPRSLHGALTGKWFSLKLKGKVYATCVSCLMHGSETWPMKVEHELTNSTEMSMIRWMCGVKLNERKKSEELWELLGLEPVSLMIKKSRLRWFGHVERKDDDDWVKRCITWEADGFIQKDARRRPAGIV